MDRFLKADLRRLAGDLDGSQPSSTNSTPCVSIFAPMYRAGREVRQNRIRFGNLLKSARQQLQELDCGDHEVEALLEPLEKMERDDAFWQHQSDGLAVFSGPANFDSWRLPCDFPELVVVGKYFYIKPLVPVLTDDQQWYILATSPKKVRLLRATRHGVEDLQPDSFPDNLREALNIDEYTSALQFHSSSNHSVTPRRGDAIHHGQGASDPDVKKKDELLQYFHRLDHALGEYFDSENSPLLFAGVQFLFPIFRSACSYRNLVDEPVTGNPDELSAEELQKQSTNIMERRILSRRSAAFSDFMDRAHTDWASDDPELIFQSARMGQVETCFIDPNQQIQVTFDENRGPQWAETNSAGAEDLINCIAVHVILNGGRVVPLPSQSESGNKSPEAEKSSGTNSGNGMTGGSIEISSGVAAIFRSSTASFLQTSGQ